MFKRRSKERSWQGLRNNNEIALILNEQGYKTKRGRPFSKDTVRDMLQNQIYLGKVSYQQCLRTADGERTWTTPVEWFDGQHEAIIDEELFKRCQEVRAKRASHHQPTINILMQLQPPPHWQETIAQSIDEALDEEKVDKRLAEIRGIIQRMDQRWDLGFITDEQEFLRQRSTLQHELETLAPVVIKDIEKAADLLKNFAHYWSNCKDEEAQHELVKRIVERVYVQDAQVVAMTPKANCHLVFSKNENGPTEYTVDPFC